MEAPDLYCRLVALGATSVQSLVNNVYIGCEILLQHNTGNPKRARSLNY